MIKLQLIAEKIKLIVKDTQNVLSFVQSQLIHRASFSHITGLYAKGSVRLKAWNRLSNISHERRSLRPNKKTLVVHCRKPGQICLWVPRPCSVGELQGQQPLVPWCVRSRGAWGSCHSRGPSRTPWTPEDNDSMISIVELYRWKYVGVDSFGVFVRFDK